MPAELAPALAKKLARLNAKQIESLAHSCKQWMEFREDLRNSTTKFRLEWFRLYLDTDDCLVTCCSDEMREIQVKKYLDQMQRSGLIEELPKDFSFENRRKWTDQVVIRTDWES